MKVYGPDRVFDRYRYKNYFIRIIFLKILLQRKKRKPEYYKEDGNIFIEGYLMLLNLFTNDNEDAEIDERYRLWWYFLKNEYHSTQYSKHKGWYWWRKLIYMKNDTSWFYRWIDDVESEFDERWLWLKKMMKEIYDYDESC